MIAAPIASRRIVPGEYFISVPATTTVDTDGPRRHSSSADLACGDESAARPSPFHDVDVVRVDRHRRDTRRRRAAAAEHPRRLGTATRRRRPDRRVSDRVPSLGDVPGHGDGCQRRVWPGARGRRYPVEARPDIARLGPGRRPRRAGRAHWPSIDAGLCRGIVGRRILRDVADRGGRRWPLHVSRRAARPVRRQGTAHPAAAVVGRRRGTGAPDDHHFW